MSEEIIIDGVNVSGCDFFTKEDLYNSYSGETQAYKGECGCSDDTMCKYIKNCCYKKQGKQLKRLQAENEELKAKFNNNLLCNKIQIYEADEARMRKALEEIRELINETCWDYTDISIIPVKDKMLEITNEVLK